MSERTGLNNKQRTWIVLVLVIVGLLCLCGLGGWFASRELLQTVRGPTAPEDVLPSGWDETSADLTVAVSPGMAATLQKLAEQFNAQSHTTPDGTTMQVQTLAVVPQKMVEDSLESPPFQAIAPDSSLWLNQLDRQWAALQGQVEGEESLIPIGNRRFGEPVRYATSPIVIAAWESVARELGWPDQPVGWQQIQRRATEDPGFKWNHPSTGHASGLLATLAEFYAGAGVTRGLTPEAAKAQSTIEYVRAVEATVRFYGEGEDVIVQRLTEEGRNFLDAFVAQEQVVIAWNQAQSGERLVALYPAEGTLWADHPLALLELGGNGEVPITDNQRRTYQAFASYLLSTDAQRQLLAAGYRPADLDIQIDGPDSPLANSDAVDWRQPQTTLQIPSEAVVEVVQNVWWYTKRPTNVYLVVDTSGSMADRDKIDLTKEALRSFVSQIQGDRDQVGLIAFSSGVDIVRSLRPLDDAGRDDMLRAIKALNARGQTALIDGVWEAHAALLAQGDTEAINAIVVMTDGQENSSTHNIAQLQERFAGYDQPIVVFTIAFGSNADDDLLNTIAEIGGGQFRRADETEIEELYKVISTYF